MAAEADNAFEIQVYKHVDSQALEAFVFRPAGTTPRPAVVLLHGGGWTAGAPEWTFAAAQILRRQGLVAIPVRYRLSGESATPLDALADACDAFAWVRANAASLGVDPKRVAGYGVSAGGQLVASAGLGACPDGRKGPDLMALWSPALDLAGDGWFRRLLKGADPARISPTSLAGRGGPPTVIVQGGKDTLTPLKGAEALCGGLKAAGGVCELNVYPGLGHLLTRNLANQESDFDVDPDADKDGDAKINAFLKAQGYIAAQ
ncbi:hypothetical protein CSW64_03555 [Caulobacter mirabilis]|uniref:Alpha/beta hydrolase fold-3 domain-containing protein n=2 Tax=Caulobacter mirabilis TaxID=69666 RepID=A0A2D2B3L7_9CAUL|nr:hypothetical protein CSW64_03555 [Caulobacter mirabilis]